MSSDCRELRNSFPPPDTNRPFDSPFQTGNKVRRLGYALRATAGKWHSSLASKSPGPGGWPRP